MQKAPPLPKNPGNRTTKPSSTSLCFVNANPLSERERQDARILIRSHASNFHWRQARLRNARPNVTHSRFARAGGVIVGEVMQPRSANHDSGEQWENDANNGDGEHEKITQVRTVHVPSIREPMDLIGISEVNPFTLYPSTLSRRVIDRVLEQGLCPNLCERGSYRS